MTFEIIDLKELNELDLKTKKVICKMFYHYIVCPTTFFIDVDKPENKQKILNFKKELEEVIIKKGGE